jgi:leader peptidase (prepilin peptidase)/N-methyltransferase
MAVVPAMVRHFAPGTGAAGRRRAAVCGAGCAVVCVAVAWVHAGRGGVVVWLVLVPLCVALAVVDCAELRLPDAVTLPMAAFTAGALGVVAHVEGGRWPAALLGAAALSGGFLMIHLFDPAQLGFGDVKLALTVGLVTGWHSWTALLLGGLGAFVSAAAVGGVLAVVRGSGRATAMPFGPSLLVGYLGAVLMAG